MEGLPFFTAPFVTLFTAIFLLSPSPCHALSLSKLPSKLLFPWFPLNEDPATGSSDASQDKISRICKTSAYPSAQTSPLDARYFLSVAIDTSSPHFAVSPRFLSLSVSPRRVTGPDYVEWDGYKLRAIAQSLSPAWLHIGGPESDYLIFVSPNDTSHLRSTGSREEEARTDVEVDEDINYYSGYDYSGMAQWGTSPRDQGRTPVAMEMYPIQWDKLHGFARKVGWKVMFTLNAQLRNGYDWDWSNAATLVEYSRWRGYTTAWQLGNEPMESSGLPNTTPISPKQLAYDFATLRNLLMTSSGHMDVVGGPGISGSKQDNCDNKMTRVQYLRRFLTEGDRYGGMVDVITWHQYYIYNPTSATVEKFTSYCVMDQLQKQALHLRPVVRNFSLPLWLGETGDVYQGGADGLSNTYAAGFLFMDKLGLAATMKVEVVMHKTLIGTNGLLGNGLAPNPTYWISVLHKQLVDNKVLLVQNSLDSSRKARVYAHCTKYHTKRHSIVPAYSYGDVTLLVLNTYHYPVNLVLLNGLKRKNKDVYILLPMDFSLVSRDVSMNGTKLKLRRSGKLPQFLPVCVGKNEDVVIPALSYGFVVIRNANVKACMNY